MLSWVEYGKSFTTLSSAVCGHQATALILNFIPYVSNNSFPIKHYLFFNYLIMLHLALDAVKGKSIYT